MPHNNSTFLGMTNHAANRTTVCYCRSTIATVCAIVTARICLTHCVFVLTDTHSIMAWHTQYRLWLLFLMCFFFRPCTLLVRCSRSLCVCAEFFARIFHRLNSSKPSDRRLLFAHSSIDRDACLTQMLRFTRTTAIKTHSQANGKKSALGWYMIWWIRFFFVIRLCHSATTAAAAAPATSNQCECLDRDRERERASLKAQCPKPFAQWRCDIQ